MDSVNLKFRFILLAAVLLVIPMIIFAFGNGTAQKAVFAFQYELMDKNKLTVTLAPVNPGVDALSAEPSNEFLMKVTVRDAEGDPVPEAAFKLDTSLQGKDGTGEFQPVDSGNLPGMRTGSDGSRLVAYKPPFLHEDAFKNGDINLKITASIPGGKKATSGSAFASTSLKLVRIPVVLIHGYKASPDIFGSMKAYLVSKGYSVSNFDYNTDNGVASGAKELERYLDAIKAGFLAKGIKVSKFDMISHSMGGLVARYYTCDNAYTARNDVFKLIFLSVPHAGSPLASLGLKYYNDQGIYDLLPDGSLFTTEFPSMINKGLNSSIQVGNILGQYDEAVSPESASLDEWGINTEMFSVGDNNFTLDNLLSGKIAEAANHKLILYNKKVFENVDEMLGADLPYPQKR